MIIALILMQQATTVVLPYPWLEYCYRTRDPGCIVETITPYDLALVNMAVTEAITTKTDGDPLDPWEAFPESREGDCDDDAATKRAALIGLGVDPKSMHFEMGEVTEPDGRKVGHLVLVVRLNGRDYILDRKTPDRIYTPEKRPYHWRAIASQSPASLAWPTGD